MTSWQMVYLGAQLLTVLILLRISAQAFELLHKTRSFTSYRSGRFLIQAFLIFTVVFLVKDIFWIIIIFARQWLPPVLKTPLTLTLILSIIQLAAAAVLTWLWERLLS